MISKLKWAILAVLIGTIGHKFYDLTKSIEAPDLDPDAYWGAGIRDDHIVYNVIRPFRITIKEDEIERLTDQLNEDITLHASLEETGFEYGVNSQKLTEFIDYWRSDYLPRWFSERQKYLNKFPHFITEIQGLNVHYIHSKANRTETKGKKVLPLLLLHGWPGTVREFYEIIPKFNAANDRTDVVFDVVAPSLPGYGWSEGSSKPGFGAAEMAIVLRNLMIRLGYQEFFIQGGDWGSLLGSNIATFYPKNVLGYHSNMCFSNSPLSIAKHVLASFYPTYFVPNGYENFHFPVNEKLEYFLTETGYFHLQATKPDTIGIALTANPIGLAAYILEKFSTWTDPSFRSLKDGGLDQLKNLHDAFLDNIMIYYLTNSITTSVRLYAESFSAQQRGYRMERVKTKVATGCARFKNDIAFLMDWQLREKYTNIVHSTYHKRGGHFAALEIPDILFNDFVEFVAIVRDLKE